MIERLMDEIYRLQERYADEPIAIEALEAVKYWVIEESVVSEGDGPAAAQGPVGAGCPLGGPLAPSKGGTAPEQG